MSGLAELLDRIVARARAGEAVEAFGVDSAQTTVRAFDGEVESLSSAHTRGVGVRVIDQGRVGYAHSADLSEDALAATLDEARTNALALTPDDANVLPEPATRSEVEGLWDPRASEVPAERKVELALAVEAAVRGAGGPIRGVNAAIYGDGVTEAAICSTTGVRDSQRVSESYLLVDALAEADGSSASAYGLSVARHPDGLDPDGAAAEAVRRASRLVGGRKPRSAALPVVLDPSVTASLLGVLGGALSAEAVQRGRSLFAGRVGESLGGPHLTLVDDGRHPDGFASAPWDGEGVPTNRTVLLESGVLRGFLHNCRSAAREGTTSTGNASRSSHRSPPGLAPTNLYLEPGTATAEEVIAGVEHGFYCQQVMGLHSGASPISGEIGVAASGLMIRDGELAEPVREASLAGSVPGLLATMEVVGGDLRFFPQHGSAGGQTVLVSEMTLAGE